MTAADEIEPVSRARPGRVLMAWPPGLRSLPLIPPGADTPVVVLKRDVQARLDAGWKIAPKE